MSPAPLPYHPSDLGYSAVLEECIETLEWVQKGGFVTKKELRLIIDRGHEEASSVRYKSGRHVYFLRLATALAYRDGLSPFDRYCYQMWMGLEIRDSAPIGRNPEIRRILDYAPGYSFDPPIWREIFRHDWERFKHWAKRLIARFISR